MNDLDLDQLDQEVSKLMDGRKAKPKKTAIAPVRPTNSAVPTNPLIDNSSAVNTPARPTAPKVEPRSENITVRRPMPKMPQRNRTRGAAMDIVQPQTPPKVAPPSAKPTHTVPALQPTKPIQPEPSQPVVHPVSEPEKLIAKEPEQKLDFTPKEFKEEPKPEVPKPTATPSVNPSAKKDENSWPDPLDFHKFDEAEPKKESPKSDIDHLLEAETSAPTMTNTKPEEPAVSPFLNTKVEKRPLGAFSESKQDAVNEPADESAITTKAEEPTPVPAMPASQTPKELSPEVMAVETAESKPSPISHDSKPEDLRQMAIPQQYKAAEHTPSDQERPVFDTKEYHAPTQPVHAAHRTGSKLGWIMIAVLIILLIVAGGLAYFAMTGDLSLDITKLL